MPPSKIELFAKYGDLALQEESIQAQKSEIKRAIMDILQQEQKEKEKLVDKKEETVVKKEK
jgi:hypothetical protein